MRSQRPDNPFDAMRRVINHEANQDDDNGFFAKLGDIEPDHAPTGHSLGLFQHMDFSQPGTPVYAAKPGENLHAPQPARTLLPRPHTRRRHTRCLPNPHDPHQQRQPTIRIHRQLHQRTNPERRTPKMTNYRTNQGDRMSDWTPDTDHIREIYSQDAISEEHRKTYEQEFNRWLAQEKAKLLRQAARDLNWFGAQGNLIHPDTAWAGVKACINALENVANEKEGK